MANKIYVTDKFYNSLRLLLSIAALTLVGCTTPYSFNPSFPNHEEEKYIGVFFDGTANDETSNTNVAKLRNLAYLQANPEIHTIYVNGVGTEGMLTEKILGMSVGYGIDKDVKHAYQYLADTYNLNKKDKILVFGFSRGAYSARVLSGVIAIAGIPDFNDIEAMEIPLKAKEKKKKNLIRDIYKAYLKGETRDERITEVSKVKGYLKREAKIEFLGLWDTVPAIGSPKYKLEQADHQYKHPSRYYDQLCNVKKAAHAMSIDDNRANIFVALNLTYDDLVKDCPNKNIDAIVNETWFAGAHSDVGGGYDDDDLSGVSLNWMISQLNQNVPDFLPKGARVFQDIYAQSHIPSKRPYIPFGNRNRHFFYYAKQSKYNGGKPKIHESVFERIEKIPKKTLEFDWGHDLNNDPKLNISGTVCVNESTIKIEKIEPPRYECKLCTDKIFIKRDDQNCFVEISEP